jgi:pimeloyl-ACP methyl ester carboxylesterase
MQWRRPFLTAPVRPRASISRSACACITSIGATPKRRHCCCCTAGAIIAATGTGSPPRCAATGTSWHRICGHGDSQWSLDGNYSIAGYVYDLAQLIHQQELAPVSILAHSLGGMIALRYAGIYPEAVRRLVAIEGLGASPRRRAERATQPIALRMQAWIDEQRALSGRLPRRYSTIEDAFRRMQEANRHLSAEQARHLTQHGVNQNEDGTYSWKFDNYVRAEPPYDMTAAEVGELWGAIACPTLLVYGRESWASNPAEDGRIRHFRNARVVTFEGAGHWVHHDRLDAFLELVRQFLREG